MTSSRIRGSQLAALALLVALVWGATQWRSLRKEDASVAQSLAAISRPGEILMISSETCVHCKLARRWLTVHNVAFRECVIERDAPCAQRYRALYAPGTPLLVVRDRVLRGFSPQAILAVLKLPDQAPLRGA